MWTQGRKKIEYLRDYVNDSEMLQAILAYMPDSKISEIAGFIAKDYDIDLEVV